MSQARKTQICVLNSKIMNSDVFKKHLNILHVMFVQSVKFLRFSHLSLSLENSLAKRFFVLDWLFIETSEGFFICPSCCTQYVFHCDLSAADVDAARVE